MFLYINLITIFIVKIINAAIYSSDINPHEPIVHLEDGKILGRLAYTIEKKNPYFAFQGIPYAQPPIGHLRFEPPQKNFKWNGTLDTTNDPQECVQGSLIVTGNEDCLYINVYVPKLNKTNLPVVVYLHGGGFSVGNANYVFLGPDYFLDEQVIFVAFNYRLGIFGFLSTGDLVAPGNNGIRDQIMALKWVQNNILYFGGDPNAVTLAGQSAGSSCVSYLIQCKQAKGLFRAAIMESGTSLNLWALSRDNAKVIKNLAEGLNINTESSHSLVEGLKKVDFRDLQNAAFVHGIRVYLRNNPLNGPAIGPVIEPPHEDAIIRGKSHELLSNGYFNHVPVIMGFNSHEAVQAGNSFFIPLIPYILITPFDINYKNFVPVDMNVEDVKQAYSLGTIIHDKYFGNSLLLSLNQSNIYQYISDDQFVRPIRETGFQQSKYAPVYFYEFSYEGRSANVIRVHPGVGHAEELSYLFRSYNLFPTPETDVFVRKRFVRLWTNFIKYINPTPYEDPLLDNLHWPLANDGSGNLIYLNISEKLIVHENPEKETVNFWNDLYLYHGNPPYDTY